MADYYQQEPRLRSRFSLNLAGGQAPVTWALLTVNVLVWLAMEYTGSSEDTDVLLDFGAMFGPLIADGEYWRLFTAMFLHVGLMHLLLNGFGLFVFGRVVERVYGSVQFAVIYLLAGLSGGVASYLINSISIGAGASGAIFGVLGAFAAYFFAHREVLGEAGRQTLWGILVMAGINLTFGFSTPGIDNWAHVGGLVGGFAVGLAFIARPAMPPNVFSFPSPPTITSRVPPRVWLLPLMVAAIVGGTWLGTVTLPDNPDSHLYSAERLLDRRSYDEALDEIATALQLNPGSGRAYLLRGQILADLDDVARARSELYKAIAIARQTGDRDTEEDARELFNGLSSR